MKKIPTLFERTFVEEIRDWLTSHQQEGIVFWKDGEPECKIKRSDFGLPWPGEEGGVLPDVGSEEYDE